MNKTLLAFGVVALLAVGFLGATLPKADEATRGAQGVQGERGAQGLAGERGERGPAGASADLSSLSRALSSLQSLVAGLQDKSKLGGFPGPDISSEFLTVNGATTYFDGKKLNTASSTLCVIKIPSATSSLEYFGADLPTGTTTATMLSLEVSNIGFAPPLGAATTTGAKALFTNEVLTVANTSNNIAWSGTTTTNVLNRGDVLRNAGATTSNATNYLVLHARVAGGASGKISQNGTGQVHDGSCSAVFRKL